MWRQPNIDKIAARGDASQLITLLHDRRADTRRNAATALGNLADPDALQPLADLVANELEESVVAAAAESLTAIAGAVAALGSDGDRILTQTMRTGNWVAANAAARALCRPDREYDQEVVEDLFRVLREGAEPSARAAALSAIDSVDPPHWIPELDRALSEGDPQIRRAAFDAIAARCDRPPFTDRRATLQMPVPPTLEPRSEGHSIPPEVQVRCAVAGGRLDWAIEFEEVAADSLIWLADRTCEETNLPTVPGRPQPLVRYDEAIDALGKLEGPRVATYLTYLLTRAGSEDRGQLARRILSALGENGDPSGVESIRRWMSIHGDWLLTSALEALQRIGTPEALEAIRNRPATWLPDHGAREPATDGPDLDASSIGATNRAQGEFDVLLAKLNDASPEVVTEAAQALGQASYPDARGALEAALRRIRVQLEPLNTEWAAWREWDPMEAYFDDDSPGHSTYRMDRDRKTSVEQARSPLITAEAAILEALRNLE